MGILALILTIEVSVDTCGDRGLKDKMPPPPLNALALFGPLGKWRL